VTFFLDQDVPDDLAHWLRHRGHLVTCLREVLPTTATDVRRRTRQAEIAATQKLLTGAGEQGLANNINFA